MGTTSHALEDTWILPLHVSTDMLSSIRGFPHVPKSDDVIMLIKWWRTLSPTVNMGHGRTNTEKAVPNNPENKAKIRYSVPISLAFEDKNHLSVQSEIFALKTERLESTAGLFDTVSSFRLIFILFKTKERWGWLTSKLSSDSLSLEKSLLRLFYTSYRLVDIKN